MGVFASDWVFIVFRKAKTDNLIRTTALHSISLPPRINNLVQAPQNLQYSIEPNSYQASFYQFAHATEELAETAVYAN